MVASVSPVRPDLQGDAMSVATMSGGSSADPADRPRRAAGGPHRAVQAGRPPASRRAMCRATSPFCRMRWRATSCGSASSIRSRARCSRSSSPGDFRLPTLADDLDIRTDLPRYRVFRQRRAGRRAGRYPRALARRPRRLRAGLLVLVRGGADRGRHRAAPHHLQCHRADVSHLDRDRRRGSVPRPAWWSRCGR